MALPARMILATLATGPFIGTWRQYAAPRPAPRRVVIVGACRRCDAETADARAAGWYHASPGPTWPQRRQLCPRCLAALWGEGRFGLS
jgi:hypothetical protein